ncbi:hypothetical protein SAMN05421693_1295 [Ectothiorhodospira magna]|uniref:Uncharacterized protein n=1 Tax=Ectothiorhodospira magna TaxID=867345 RepID=A0A1H9FSE6_9GAMM|nr:hypothetical protein [Ectothiorhodospira magna]SEQ40433.1 hypothetical protein SAMN05421693_1295 [Ectothiorhodospira magna]
MPVYSSSCYRRVSGPTAALLTGAVALTLSLGALAAGPGTLERDGPRQVCRDLSGEAFEACRDGIQAAREARRGQQLAANNDRPREGRLQQEGRGAGDRPRMTDEERETRRAEREERRGHGGNMTSGGRGEMGGRGERGGMGDQRRD